MRMAPRGEVGWRLCPAKLDRQPVLFAHALLTVRETSAAPCLRDRNHTTRTSTWARGEGAFRRLLSSASKPSCPSIVYSLPISAQSYAFIQGLSISQHVVGSGDKGREAFTLLDTVDGG